MLSTTKHYVYFTPLHRPIDCETGAEIRVEPGFISKVIYKDGPKPGMQQADCNIISQSNVSKQSNWWWSCVAFSATQIAWRVSHWIPTGWGIFPDMAHKAEISVPGIGPGGSGAICVSISPSGSISFRCRECYRAGYQPFKGAHFLKFWIKSNSLSKDPFASSTPAGQVPDQHPWPVRAWGWQQIHSIMFLRRFQGLPCSCLWKRSSSTVLLSRQRAIYCMLSSLVTGSYFKYLWACSSKPDDFQSRWLKILQLLFKNYSAIGVAMVLLAKNSWITYLSRIKLREMHCFAWQTYS